MAVRIQYGNRMYENGTFADSYRGNDTDNETTSNNAGYDKLFTDATNIHVIMYFILLPIASVCTPLFMACVLGDKLRSSTVYLLCSGGADLSVMLVAPRSCTTAMK